IKETPETEPSGPCGGIQVMSPIQTKEFFYDGVRRIQEVITRHLNAVPVENDELVAVTDDGDPGQPAPPPPQQTGTWTDREYIYGPDYVDEFVCQIDRYGAAIYMLQDANYNVVALLTPAGGVLEQYT